MISIGGHSCEFFIIDTGGNNQKGMTLIEVLAALLLLSWLALCMPVIFSPVATWIAKARLETTAVNYAASMLEALRAEPAKISPLNTGKTAEELGLNCENPGSGITGQILHMQQQQSVPGLYEVAVIISWSQAGQPQTLQLVTLIRKEE